jgi:predicted NBD/HSP70 family sugar kinase
MNLVALGSVADRNEHQLSDMVDTVVVHIGEGIGAGIIVGGRIIRGFSSFAGEVGYVINPSSENQNKETIEVLVGKADGIEQKAKYIAEILVNIICLLNPPAIALGGILATEEMIRHLRFECERHLPLWALPSFKLMADENAAYDKGLLAAVRDVIINDVAIATEGNTINQ